MASVLLLVEQDAALRGRLSAYLRAEGHHVHDEGGFDAGRRVLAALSPDILMLGFDRVDGEGIAFLREVRCEHANLPVIMVTASMDNALAVTAMREGAYDFLREPIPGDALSATLGRALAAQQNHAHPVGIPAQDGLAGISGLVGGSRAIVEVCKQIGQVAPTGVSVLITGESGTGKEIVARAIHAYSGCAGPFQPINCAAIVDTLLESELFGHEKGSFTGAIARRQGKFELAGEGVLFLDEISELPLHLQAKLLRVLQEGVFERVGGSQTLPTTARIVAASNRDLGEMTRAGGFREDLYYRIKVVTLSMPPLRERLEDMPALVEHLLGRIAAKLGGRVPRLTESAMRILAGHVWPGNVRELENVLTRALIMSHGDTLTPDLLAIEAHPPGLESCRADTSLLSLDELEARHVASVLAHTHWHRGHACAILGISRPALERKIRKHNLAPK
jgi:two-component system response regulator AtoC